MAGGKCRQSCIEGIVIGVQTCVEDGKNRESAHRSCLTMVLNASRLRQSLIFEKALNLFVGLCGKTPIANNCLVGCFDYSLIGDVRNIGVIMCACRSVDFKNGIFR